MVFLSVLANGVGWGEYGNEVRVQFLRRDGGETAQAGQAPFPFQVNQSVGSLVVSRHEYLKEMVSYCLVVGLVYDEAAHALVRWHFVAFPLAIR